MVLFTARRQTDIHRCELIGASAALSSSWSSLSAQPVFASLAGTLAEFRRRCLPARINRFIYRRAI